MKLTGAQIVMECLAREGVEHIFGYPGGANLPLYDTLPQCGTSSRPLMPPTPTRGSRARRASAGRRPARARRTW